MLRVSVGEEEFDLGAEARALEGGGAGAVVTFTGVVRGDGGLEHMEIEHYPGMTERAIGTIGEAAMRRWSLTGATVIHRHGRLAPGERIMMVATAAPHRADAFAAAEFLMDYLKSRAPFWKKEVRAHGAAWVEARDEDEAALQRW
jgi:molybdopterin synthase catalytic subunit